MDPADPSGSLTIVTRAAATLAVYALLYTAGYAAAVFLNAACARSLTAGAAAAGALVVTAAAARHLDRAAALGVLTRRHRHGLAYRGPVNRPAPTPPAVGDARGVPDIRGIR